MPWRRGAAVWTKPKTLCFLAIVVIFFQSNVLLYRRANGSFTLLEKHIDNANGAPTPTAKKGPAIVMLLPNHPRDVPKAKAAIESMDRHLADESSNPLLLFNEGDLPDSVREEFEALTKRRVHWPLVNFSEFPAMFEPSIMRDPFQKRGKFGYWQMCRFWIYKIWTHPILDQYASIMRMDTDSCFLGPTNSSLPHLPQCDDSHDPSCRHVYSANDLCVARTTRGILELTHRHLGVDRHSDIVPSNPDLWAQIPNNTLAKTRFPAFYTNFEVADVSFFRRPDVMAFQRAMTDEPPFGVFRNQWGDAPIRLLTLALFAGPNQVAMGQNANYGHANQCSPLWP